MSTLTIPRSDLALYASLNDDVKKEVREWQQCMAALTDARRIGVPIGAACREQALVMGVSKQTVRRKWDDWRRSGDWTVFINRAKAVPVRNTLPTEFVERHWWVYLERNQRATGSKAAWRQMIRDWRAGKPVPGYDTPPPPDSKGRYPVGWSYSNLMKRLPSRFAITAMRDGLGTAMAKHGPKVMRTRVGLWVGSHILIDDVLRDIRVAWLGQGGKLARVQELGALDLYSAHRFAVGRRPQYKRDSDGKKDSVKERDARFLVASILRNTGYSPRGTQWVVELGTAAVREKLEYWMRDHISPVITVSRPGITGKAQALAGYWGSGGGNPRHKAPQESHHNLMQNEAGMLPANVGHNRTEPEWLHGLEAVTKDVLKWLAQLPPEKAMLLRLPMLEYHQACGLLDDIGHAIATRTDHNLEGWVDCGHTTVEYRLSPLSDEWLTQDDFLALPSGHQSALMAAADKLPDLVRPRKLSPLEVFQRGQGDLIRVSDHIIALMFCDRDLGDDLRQTKRLTRGGTIEINDSEVYNETVVYEGLIITPEGQRQHLDERKRYGVVNNPFHPDALWVYDDRGAYLGTAPRRTRASYLDEHAQHVNLAERNKVTAELLGPIRDRHAGAEQELADLQEHNRRIRTGEAVTKEEIAAERAAERRINRERGTVDDLITTPPQPAPSPDPVDDDNRYSITDLI